MKTLYSRITAGTFLSVEHAADGIIDKGPEVFHFLHYRFYIARMLKMIEEKKLPAHLENVDITAWAEGMLGLSEKTRKSGHIGMIRLDMKHIKNMPESRLKQPGIMVLLKQGAIVVDGNHRVARNYLDGNKNMPMWLVKEADAKKARVMTR